MSEGTSSLASQSACRDEKEVSRGPDDNNSDSGSTKEKETEAPLEHSSFITYPDNPTSRAAEDDLSGEAGGVVDCDTRLWIGNLDPRLREFHLLKMVQRYGTIDNFDFLFHRTGPNIGLPRGYAFVTFQDKEAAETCLKSLDGTKVLEKHVAVRWAHQATATFIDEEAKLKSKLPALSIKKDESPSETSSSSVVVKAKAISAIEAKLKAMEREKEAGEEAGSSSNFFYQYNKEAPVATIKTRPKHYDRSRPSQNRRRPYRR